MPELKRLSTFLFGDPKRDDTSHLVGFPKAWKTATCNDPVFIQTQLDVGQAMYMKPALKYAASVGVKSNLGKAIFYGKFTIFIYKSFIFITLYSRHYYSTWLAGKNEKKTMIGKIIKRIYLVCRAKH